MVQAPVENAGLEQKSRKIQADLGNERKQLPARDSAAPNCYIRGDIIVLERKP